MAKVTISTLDKMKAAGERFVCVTAYDATFARVVCDAGAETILVGDSLGMV
ncbi:MAG: 3-methyl-2-oxobutanoate hydroxymethyltransferase, partial [Halioglobus sp.]|nr:3-methyl-2-oxobutanoate hydroxymethyltransferase [Halioglobus sp.]